MLNVPTWYRKITGFFLGTVPELGSKGEGKGKVRWYGTIWVLLNLRTNQLNLLSRTESFTEKDSVVVESKLNSTGLPWWSSG